MLGLASALGAEPLAGRPLVRGVNQALSQAARVLADQGASALLVVAADIPTALPADIEALLDALPERGIAICPTGDRGTGALPPPRGLSDNRARDHRRRPCRPCAPPQPALALRGSRAGGAAAPERGDGRSLARGRGRGWTIRLPHRERPRPLSAADGGSAAPSSSRPA